MASGATGSLPRCEPTRRTPPNDQSPDSDDCGPQEFDSCGDETVFVMEAAENGFDVYGIGLSATVS